MVCMIMLKAIYIFELCFLSIFLMEGIKKRRKKKACGLLLKGRKLIIGKQAEPWPPTPFIWAAMGLIILLERLRVRAPQPALYNCHKNTSHRTQR